MERERLRARYLTLLAHLADYHYGAGNHEVCLDYAWRLLACDPCREDAHRLIMRCYVRQGERAEALRHYRLCVDILRAEFKAAPEAATTTLFEQIRLDPGQRSGRHPHGAHPTRLARRQRLDASEQRRADAQLVHPFTDPGNSQ